MNHTSKLRELIDRVVETARSVQDHETGSYTRYTRDSTEWRWRAMQANDAYRELLTYVQDIQWRLDVDIAHTADQLEDSNRGPQ